MTKGEATTLKRRLNKRRAMRILGGACACCGMDNPYFLSVDHVAGDGGVHRAAKVQTNSIHEAIIRGENLDRYQVLCLACNFNKGKRGYCMIDHGADPWMGVSD